jgi:hypothetical protein
MASVVTVRERRVRMAFERAMRVMQEATERITFLELELERTSHPERVLVVAHLRNAKLFLEQGAKVSALMCIDSALRFLNAPV